MISNRYFPSIALKADKTSELYNFVSFVNLVKADIVLHACKHFLLFSTKTAYCTAADCSQVPSVRFLQTDPKNSIQESHPV